MTTYDQGSDEAFCDECWLGDPAGVFGNGDPYNIVDVTGEQGRRWMDQARRWRGSNADG